MDEILNSINNNIQYMKLDIETSPDEEKAITEYLLQLIVNTDNLIRENKRGRKKVVNILIIQKIKAYIKNYDEWLFILYDNYFGNILDSYDDEKKELLNFYFLLNTIDDLDKNKLYELWEIFKMFFLVNFDRVNYMIKYKKIILNRINNTHRSSDEEVPNINENINIIKPKIRSLCKELK